MYCYPIDEFDKRFILLIPETATFRRAERRHAPIKKLLPLPKPKERQTFYIEMIQHKKLFGNMRNKSIVGAIMRSA